MPHPSMRKLSFRAAAIACLLAVFFLMALVSDSRRIVEVARTHPAVSEEQITAKVSALSAEKQPNVIVLLSESFWDPTQLDVQFSRDPIPFFHSLRKTFSGGWMLSPQHGGGTANVEFEVLTGNAMRFLPKNTIAYESHVTHPIESLATILNGQGYVSTAISPAPHYLFNSTEVYKRLGFSQFISLEFFPRDYEGPYMADRAVVRQIIEKAEATEEPDFIFANTMENHYHYYPGKFKANTIEVKADLPGGSAGLLETLAQGLSGADRALQELVEYYAASKEPTVILFFGDHQPFLEKDYKVYREAGYLKKDDPEEWWKMFSTPFVIWDNFLPMNKQDLKMNASFLLPALLEHAKLPDTAYTTFLRELCKQTPVIPPDDAKSEIRKDEASMLRYKEFQEQMLSESHPLPQEPKRPFVFGYADFRIDSAAFERKSRLSGEGIITLTGKHFGLGSKVVINGQPLKTTWKSQDTVSAVVTSALVSASDPWSVHVIVEDDKEKEIARTPEFTFTR